MKHSSSNPPLEPTVQNLSQAIFTINRHAKTAPNPKFLYSLKKKGLEKMLQLGQAKKIGLHFSRYPKLCQQRSDVLVQCGDYLFHMPPSNDDFQKLPHLGKLDAHTRNPKSSLNLHSSKSLLMNFTGLQEPNIENTATRYTSTKQNPYRSTYQSPVFKRLGER